MKLKQFIFALVAMLSFSFSVFAQNEAKIGTTEYQTLKQAVEAAAAGDEIVLLKNVTLQGGYDADPTAGLRIEKALTINGNKKTIDCGTFKDGIRVYITGSSKADVKFENVTIKNNNPYGRCIDMRTGKIALEVKSGAKLIAQGVNSQPLTIGGSSATYRVRVSNATIDAGETGYGIISFVRLTNNIEISSSAKISGLAALYLKEGVTNTTVNMGNGTYTGTNLKSAESGTFGAVVIEGDNNTIVVNHEKSVVKAVAGDDVNQAVQAAFLVKEGATGNKIQVTNAKAQVLTQGAQAQWAVVASDATGTALTNNGQAVNFAVECGGYLYMDANKAFSMVIPQEKEATTVKLLSDVTLDNTWTVAADQDITLDLNGKTINVAYAEGSTTNHIYAIDNKGKLKITGNGTINARGIFNYGAMTLENGTINAIDGNGGYGVRNYAGSLTMNGGTIATTLEDDNKVDKGGYDATTVRVDEGATFTMNDGELKNICDYTFAIENHGTTTVKGGKATSVHTTVANYGTINIEGGEFVCNGLEGITAHAVWAAEGTTNISGGTFNGKDNFNGFNVDASEGAVVNITGGTFLSVHSGSLYGNGTIAVSGGIFFDAVPEKYCAKGYAPIELGNGTYGVQEGQIVALIGSAKYFSLADALAAAKDGETISLQWRDDYTPIAMNGSLYGKSVTITGTATVDWSKGFLFVARGGAGNATLTFDNANLTSASNQATYGIHVSGREKDTADKYDGTLVIKNSTIDLDYLINKGAMTLDNSTLTVKNGFDLNGRPAKETENGEDANATLALTNGSKLVVNNHNGMGIGREGQGVMNIDATSTFEHTQDFLVSANGTMDVQGTLVSNGKKLTNNGEVKFTATKLTDANIEGTGTTRFYNDVNFYGANSITTTNINGTPFHLVVNEGANLFITRFVLGYDRNITVNGTIADASAFNPEGQTPSLKFNSTSGVSVGGTGTGNLQVKNAYIELGNSSWKNAQGTYDWDFVNSYVSATSFTDAKGADAATWDVTFDNSILDAKNYIKNGKNVTYNFTNNSHATTGSLRIDGELNIDATSSVVTTSQQNNKVGAVDEHGGINGTVKVAGNLTIGSNSKTQLEVLGGNVNVVEGATLALGNNTLTLDAASAMQSAGNISGAITAANGANVAISGGTYTQDVNNWCVDGFMTQQNADGSFGIAKAVAKVGDKKYATLDEAVQAAKVDDKITLLDNADLAFAHNPQFNYVYASEIDLNGKTMTMKKGDVRFDNVTIKNGNIIVQPGTYKGTAIFLMYSKNLTLDGVKVTATGVASTYLIGLEGTSNLNLLNGSEIVINNESLVNIGSIIADNGNGNTVTIKDSKIDIKNSDARLYLGGTNGKITVENSDIDLNGVKEGFYLRAGQTLAITGTSTVDITLNTNEGRYGINLTDATAKYTKAETATVNATLFEKKGGKDFNGYTSADGIWGETWGNAKQSFVIKVLDANGNVMGTTSLNNIGGIFDGDVNATWYLKFNPASNTDEYWTMEWKTAPSISNMPARVALWVDGVEVSGGPVVLNGPDNLWPIYAAVTDANGKILSCYTSVANAAATNATNIALLRETTEEIELPVGTILNKNGFTAAGVTVKPVAKVGNTEYASIDAAIAAWTNNTTLTLLADVTLSDVIQLSSTEMHTLDLGTFTMTAASKKDAIQIVNNGRSSASYALDIKADANNPGGITATGKAVVRTTGKSGVKDRPIIRFYNGVFTGTNVIYHSGSTGTNCPQFQFHGGVFNGTVYANRALIQFYGGTFNGSLQMSVDSSAYALVAGGRFKQLSNLYMSALNSSKFTIGSAKGVYDREVYIDEEGYYVVAKTEPAEGIEADVAKKPGTNDYLAYSKVGTEGQLGYTDVETALKNNTTATVTVYADEVDMNGTNFKGTIIIPKDGQVTITGAPADLKVKTQDGYFLENNNGTYKSMLAVAKVGDKEFETVQKALQYAIDNSAAEVVVLTDVREKMVTDFDLVIKANLTIKAADKFTAEAPAKVEFYNEGTSMDFAVGTADGAERCTLTIAENVHFDLVDRVIWLGYYGNNVDVVVNGYFGGYQIWHGANTTVNNGGMLDSHGEAFIMRRNATLTANEGAKVKANYFQIYSGHINATGADITAGLVWVDGAHSYGSEGNVSFTLNNTSFVSNGEVKMTVAEGKNIPVSVTNGSAFTAKGKMTLANSVDVTVDATSSITHNNGQAFKLPVATINGLKYTSLQAAVDAVKNGETIVLVDVVTENVTLTEKVGVYYTIDGAGKQFKGSISVNSLSDTNDNRRITIKNIKFVDDSAAKVDFITSVNTNHYPRLTVEGCTFTGSGDATDVALRLKSSHSVVITNCTGTGLHSFLQNTSGWNLTIENVKVTESKGAFALGTVQGVTIKGSTIYVATYGIRIDADTYNNNAVIDGNNVTAFIPVVVRKVNTQSNVTFTGDNTFAADNNDGKWMVIGTTEYEEGVALPAEVAAGNVVVALNGNGLGYDGIHGAGLAGKGTAEAPYLINNVAELEIFRNSVNAGSAKYSKPGLCVALNADIDMAGVNWVGIGSATKDHGFMGNFDGKTFKIKNLTIDTPALDSDGYAYAGLFGVTEGTDKDNQNVIKNLTIENVTINTTGDIVSAAIAYPYYTIVDNVKVCGNIAITGGNYTAGVLAYTRRCVNASNLSVVGNDGSYVKGNLAVGGVISDIQTNGGLVVDYKNFTAEGITVKGEKQVGGISGIIAAQTLDGAAVKNVTLESQDNLAGVVAGRLGGTSTISNVVSENVTGATAVIGATYDGAKAVEARIGDTYYSTFAAAYTAAKAGETVTMLTDLNMSEILVLDKAITLDGNGKTLTSTAARAINVDCEGNVGIKNLTINASGERAINVITKPANVTIENVTATAANYTVNLAGSAAGAVVDVKNSNLTGLNVVNVAAAGAQVTVDNTTLNCADHSEAEGYAALVLNKDAKNGSIVATNVTFNIGGDSRKASNQAEGGIITIDGSADEVEQHVAYISYGNNWYGFATLEAAIAKANAGETVTLLRDITASAIITIDKAITLDGNGKTLTSTAGRAINVDCDGDVAIKNLTINAKGERAINVIQKPANVTIDGVTATAANYTVNLASSAGAAKVAISNSTLNGLCTVNVSAAGAKVTVDNSTVNCNDNNTTAGEAYAALCLNKEAVGGSIVATNTTVNVAAGSDSMKGRNSAENGTVTINGSTDGVAVMVAVITYEGSDYYHSFSSLAEAVEFAKAGDVITLISDVTVAQPVVINKSVTLDGNGKTLTYTGTDRAIEMPNVADANYDVTIKNLNVVATTANRGLNYNDNGKLNVEGVTVTIGENVDGYAINFPGMADGAQVTIKDSKLTSRNPLNIWGENMLINVYGSEIISVDNSTTYDYAAIQLNNDNSGNVANGTTVNVYGGTITALNEKGEPSNVVANASETGVVNISDETVITGKVLDYVANIGGVYFGSLQAAVNAIEKYGNSPIVIMKSFSTSEATTIKSGLKVTINLNGKTITGTDNETKSYGLININPGAELTINDATGNGAITLTATNDRDWNAYSSVISNQRGKLTVNGGTIEHLGGTDMAYAIDNLTNTGAQNAETVINGGTIKSTYRAVRQFLNSTTAQNILTVNGGTIEGTNKSIWMQDANANANPGALTVAADAAIKGDVYLTVTAGSAKWPVTVAVAAAALQGESKVLTSNVPAGYDLANVDGIYGIYSGAAKIGTTYYETVDAAIKAAKAGETVNILAGTYKVPSMKAGITVEGAVNADGTPAVLLEGTLSNTLENLTLKNLHIKGGNAQRWAYAKGDLFFENVIFEATSVYALHFDGIAAGTNLTYKNCTIIGWAAMGGTPESCVFDGCTIKGNGSYGVIRTYFDAEIKDCTFDVSNVNTNDAYQDGIHAVDGAEVAVNGCTNDNGTMKDLVNISGTSEVTVDGVVYKNVAKVADKNYITIEDAFAAWADGTTLTLLTDIALDTKTLATQNDGYAAIINVAGKAVTLDLNGKKITVDAKAADLANASGKMLLAVFSADLGGHLTLTDNSDAKNGAVTLNVNDAKVYSMFASESKESDKSNSGKLTVNGGNYTTVGNVSNAMFFTDANEVITVNGGNFHCDGASTTANYPWMFNTVGNNELHVTVNGGTFNVDINHQHRPFEVKVPETLAVKANDNGTWTVVPAEAYITEMLGATVNEAGEWGHEVGYATIAEAIAAVNELGNKVSIAKDLELTEAVVVPADKTVVLDLNGKTVTMNDASGATAVLLKNNGNLTIMDGTEAKAGKLSFKTTTPSAANAYASNTISNYGTLTIESGNVENLSVGGGACYALDNYAGSTATINGGKLTAEKTAVRIFNWTNGEEAKATINMNGGEIYSKNGYGINVNSGNAPFVALNIAGGTITTDYADYKLAVYVVNKGTAENFTANVTGGTFNGIFALNGVTAQTMKQGAVAVSGGTFEGVTCYEDPAYGFVSGGTFKSVVDAKAVATGFICKDNGDGTFGVIVDPKHGMVAQIIRNDYYAENQYFATINDAVQAAVTGETVTLIADVETSAAGYATITDGYAVIVAVKEKDITLNLNGKSVTVTPTADELDNAEGDMLMSVFGMDTNGKLTLTGNGSVKVNANGANVYSLVAAYGEGSAVVIENGNYEADAVNANGSLIYAQQAECIAVMGGTFNLGNLGTGANGSPWIFNTKGQNYTGVKVVGGTYPTDINHQFWANEVLVPEAYALKNNGDGTWTVVDAVAYTNEKATSRGASWRHVGYASLEDAIAATGKYNCQNNTVTLIKDLALEPITVANGVKVAIDLNGKTISATDNSTATYCLITNKGDLTINGTGAIQLTADNDRGWGARSAVISNEVGGKLTVNGGTIEHLGGTAMAYAIDNLTNGKGTYAETIINGGEIKSTYRPIRMFLNGVEADNILTVNAGTIESTGGNKAAIWMQDPSNKANTGTLYVGADAVIKNNVYLDVTEGSTEWPVEAYIAKAALAEGKTVIAENVPADAAALVEYDTFWQVEQKNLAALTIEDDCEEYINKIEKNVGVLTYERYFDDTEWQTIVLPFDVPVANLMDEFDVAYIYNASYKGKQATIDYVVVEDSEFVLAANYPYMIRAKEAGWNNIVVENAKLMPTEVEILDCSSIFEKFSFIGNYATVDAPSNDGMGYFNLTSGAWSKMETINPFRFYMQIKLRNGAAFEYPTEAQAIRMRSVNANGEETTGINGVDAEQAGDFIFDLHGRRVLEPEKGGIYIVNGKKVMF